MDELMSSPSPNCSSLEHLHHLLQRVTACLQGLPGFQTLSIFGSFAEGRADGYSDIDLLVTTDELQAAQQHLLGILESVSPVEACWVIGVRPDEWNSTIILSEEGYFHRLDLGLVSTDAADPLFLPARTKILATRTADLPDIVPCQHQAFTPPYGSVGHFLLGQYLGGLRYVKARKRGQVLTCYRFVSAAADWCLCVLYAHLTVNQLPWPSKLSTGEYTSLDRLDVEGRGRAILTALDYSTPENMDQSLCGVMQQMHRLCQEIAAMRNERLDDGVFQRMLAFMRQELGVTE